MVKRKISCKKTFDNETAIVCKPLRMRNFVKNKAKK